MHYRLRSLLLLVTFVAVHLGILFSAPEIRVFGLSLITAFALPVSVGGIVYSCHNWRAFFIGCTVGAAPYPIIVAMSSYTSIFAGLSPDLDEIGIGQIVLNLLYFHVLILSSGLTVVAVRWICTRQELEQKVNP